MNLANRNKFINSGFLKRATAPKRNDITTYDVKVNPNVRWDSTPGLKKDDLFNLHNCKQFYLEAHR